MKAVFWPSLLMFFLGLQSMNAQPSEKICLSILKETKGIDSLMDLLSGSERASARSEEHFSNDSCWIIELIDVKDYIAFQIIKSSKTTINQIVNRINTKKGSYGFFKYRSHEILVWDWDSDSYYGLFSKLNEIATIDFIYKLKNDYPDPAKNFLYGPTFHYKYQKNQISLEGGPPPVLPRIK